MTHHSEPLVLVLTTNPMNTVRLRLDSEIKRIRRALEDKPARVHSEGAVTADEIQNLLLKERPTVVHISGHGAGNNGIKVEDSQGMAQVLPTGALVDLFRLCKGDIRCVVFNACDSVALAKAVSQHIPYVIGMRESIGDDASTKFAAGFYEALSEEKSFEEAFELGCNAIDINGIAESRVPVLFKQRDDQAPQYLVKRKAAQPSGVTGSNEDGRQPGAFQRPRVVLAHLSDIHIKSEKDKVLERAELIARALAWIDPEVDGFIIIVTGDITYSGLEAQYEAATVFLQKIKTELQKLAGKQSDAGPLVEIIPIPGNLDCDFRFTTKLRKMALAGVAVDRADALDSDIVKCCTEVQQQFRIFSAVFLGSKPDESNLHFSRTISIGESKIQINCYNTAWLSSHNEQRGDLYFPEKLVRRQEDNAAMVVSAFHHTYNWLEQTNAREFRGSIEETSSIVLTGNENSDTQRIQEADENFTYIEGAVLSEAGRNPSGFNAIILDVKTKTYKLHKFSWNGEMYASHSDGNTDSIWDLLPLLKLKSQHQFRINAKFEKYLEELGLTLTQREKGHLKLSDVYVFPDLREVKLRGSANPKTIRGNQVLGLVLSTNALLITGDSQSGKTALAKSLFSHFYRRGDVPILLKASRKLLRNAKITSIIYETFQEQYDARLLDDYKHIETGRRIIIIDDINLVARGGRERRKLVEELQNFAGRIILLCDDVIKDLEDMAGSGLPEFNEYRIQPFGYIHRNDLVQKWLSLGTPSDAAAMTRQLNEITRRIDAILGRGVVPAYPVYVLSILQATEAAVQLDTSASTQGYFYELLIRAALAEGRTNKEFDVLAAYLSFIAFSMFENGGMLAEQMVFTRIHHEYENRHDIKLNIDSLTDLLIDKRILYRLNDRIGFRYRYVYSYFVANYMRDHIHDKRIMDIVSRLSESLYKREYADIMLFLSHLSKDPFIVKSMVSAADALYKDMDSVKLTEDIKFLTGLETGSEVTYEIRNLAEARRDALAARDEAEARDEALELELEMEDPQRAEVDPVVRMIVALRTLQILGQVLKNFPGYLEAEEKLRIARSCYLLGTRAWAYTLSLLRDNEREIFQSIVELLLNATPNLSLANLPRRVLNVVIALVRWSSFGFVWRIASAIGTSELSATYDKLIAEQQSLPAKLVHVAILLEHSPTLPEGALFRLHDELRKWPLAVWILNTLVTNHFNLFYVDMPSKQRICEKLGISIKNLQAGTDPKNKLLPK